MAPRFERVGCVGSEALRTWKSENMEGTRKVYRHLSIVPKMLDDGAVRKLANAMPTTMPTCVKRRSAHMGKHGAV